MKSLYLTNKKFPQIKETQPNLSYPVPLYLTETHTRTHRWYPKDIMPRKREKRKPTCLNNITTTSNKGTPFLKFAYCSGSWVQIVHVENLNAQKAKKSKYITCIKEYGICDKKKNLFSHWRRIIFCKCSNAATDKYIQEI